MRRRRNVPCWRSKANNAEIPKPLIPTEEERKARLASAINLKELPPLQVSEPSPVQPVTTPTPSPAATPPEKIASPQPAQPNLAAALTSALSTPPLEKTLSDATGANSPANTRRQMEEQQQIAKTTAPPAIKPTAGDPYREAVD